MKKVICFNAPPNSGKDTGAKYLQEVYGGEILSIAAPIKRLVSEVYRVSVPKLEKNKNNPLSELLGCTPRECYIHFGETIKKLHGDNYWVDFAVNHIGMSRNNLFIIPDLGFRNELLQLVKAFGIENVLVVKLSRPECDFEKDSRSYVSSLLEIKNVKNNKCFVDCLYLKNDGSKDFYREQLIERTGDFLGKKARVATR
jgi:hypothetical protein